MAAEDREKLAHDCLETISQLTTIDDAKNIDALKVLEFLGTCDRDTARIIITSLQTRLEQIAQENFNAQATEDLTDDSFQTTNKNQFTEVPLHWWKNGSPQQKILALFTLKSFKNYSYQVLEDERRDEVVKFDTQSYLVTLDDVKALAPHFTDLRLQALQSSYQLIVDLFEHMQDRTKTSCIATLKAKPTIINVGGLYFDGRNGSEDTLTRLFLCSSNFTDFRFFHCSIINNDFTGSILDDCYFPKCTVENNKFIKIHMEYARMRFHIKQASQNNSKPSRYRLINWHKNNFDDATIIYADFRGDTNSTTNLAKSSFKGATLVDCELTGVQLPSDLSKTRLLDCVVNKAYIKSGYLEEADFRGSTFEDTTFESLADNTVFRRTNLNGVDLSKSQFTSQYRGDIVFEDCSLVDCKLPPKLHQRRGTMIQRVRSPKNIDSLQKLMADINKERGNFVPETVYTTAQETMISIIRDTNDLRTMLHILEQLEQPKHWQKSYDIHYEACKRFLDIVMHRTTSIISLDYHFSLLELFKRYHWHVSRHKKQPHQLQRLKFYIRQNILLFNNCERHPAPKPFAESTWEIKDKPITKKPGISIHELIERDGIGLR